MDLFGKKAIEAERKNEELEARLEGLKKELAQARKKNDDLMAERKGVEEQAARLKAQVAETESARAKARECQAKAEQMVKWQEDRYNLLVAGVEKGRQERDEAVAAAAEAKAEADRARADVERLKADLEHARAEAASQAARLARAAERPQRPAPVPASEEMSADMETLKTRIALLERHLAEQSEGLRVALRKAEHNRRAYLITQMQLDMAEDRLYLITKGTVRPLFEDGPEANRDEGGRPVAEDVEGYEYEDTPTPEMDAAAPEEPAPVAEDPATVN